MAAAYGERKANREVWQALRKQRQQLEADRCREDEAWHQQRQLLHQQKSLLPMVKKPSKVDRFYTYPEH
jgi:hypothetical protein